MIGTLSENPDTPLKERDVHEQGVKLFLHHGDLTDSSRLVRLLYELQPDEVYHLGAQSHVRVSFDVPEYTADVTGMGTLRLLEAIRETGVKTRFYQASSSEMFGAAPPPQDDDPGNPTVSFRGERRSNATHRSTTDPDARLAKKSDGKEAKLSYQASVLLDNRHGLVVATTVSAPSGT